MSIDRAIRDSRRFVTGAGFSLPVLIRTPQNPEFVEVRGLTSRHHLEVDGDGYPVNSTNSHVTLSEPALVASGFTVRNSRSEVDLSNWVIKWTDGTGTERSYKIISAMPSETLGLIICTVARYGSN